MLYPSTQVRTRVVMLGTGTPIADPDRGGPAIAIVVDGVPYLFDAGVGVVRSAARAARDGLPQLRPANLRRLFLTHLHSDHTMGFSDVLFTPTFNGRPGALEVFGPQGTERFVSGIREAYAEDMSIRRAGGASPALGQVIVREIVEGEVYRDARITIRAFAVPHGSWEHAFGYHITTPDKVIVISGDTRASPVIARECNGCDILIHEVYSDSGFLTRSAERQSYHSQAHTSASQLGAIATQARPGLLVLYHQLYFGASDERLLSEVRAAYRGAVVSAKDGQHF
jgi:ribonuclease Z